MMYFWLPGKIWIVLLFAVLGMPPLLIADLNSEANDDEAVDLILYTKDSVLPDKTDTLRAITERTVQKYRSSGYAVTTVSIDIVESWVDQYRPELRGALQLRKQIAFAHARNAWVIGGLDLMSDTQSSEQEKQYMVYGWIHNLSRISRGSVVERDIEKARQEGLELMDSFDTEIRLRALLRGSPHSRYILHRDIQIDQVTPRRPNPLWSKNVPFWGIGFDLKDQNSTSYKIGNVVPDSPAAKAGLTPGSQITRINNIGPESRKDLVKALRETKLNESVLLEVHKHGVDREVSVRPVSERQFFRPRAKRFLSEAGDNPDVISLPGKKLCGTSLEGNALLCFFWATWCEPCKEPLVMIDSYASRKLNNLVVLSVSVDTDVRHWSKFVVDNRLDGYHVCSPSWAKQFGVHSFPSIVLVSGDRSRFERYDVDDLAVIFLKYSD